MIKKTFCHIDGVSETTEKKLWENNINSWEEFLDKHNEINFLPQSKIQKIKNEVLFSKQELEDSNLKYFKEKVPDKLHYRLSKYGKIAYLDIETTGLSRYTDIITMIGIYDGETAKSYINGIDLEEAYSKLKDFDIVVTFNGKSFDMPFIEHHAKIKYNIIHLDLRYLLKEFGFAGGLKKIETELGITRDDEVKGVDGFEAVRLWKKYKNGDETALRKLLIYNKEDIVNLKYLLEYYLERKISSF